MAHKLPFPDRFYAAVGFAANPPLGSRAVSDETRLLLYALYQQVRAHCSTHPAAKSQFKREMNSHPIQRPPIRRSPHTLNPHLTRSPPVRATPRSPSGTHSNAPSGTRGTHSVP